MFSIRDKVSYIKAIQRMLSLPETGRVDSGMRRRIKALQGENGYPKSGIVDYQTHLLIKKAYRSTLEKRLLPEPIAPYETSPFMPRINAEMSELIRLYHLPLRAPKGRVYGFDAVRAAERLRAIYALDQRKELDGELYLRVRRDLMSRSANIK